VRGGGRIELRWWDAHSECCYTHCVWHHTHAHTHQPTTRETRF
jgi:hypothetical protein